MANNAKKLAVDCVGLVILGGLIGVGLRLAEWTIPAPEMRVVICAAGKDDTIQTCKDLNELRGAYEK